MPKERLQKVLAAAGVASRRAAEQLIVDGRVRVNGRIVRELGTRVDPKHDRLDVDDKRVVRQNRVYYVFHKPRAVVSTLKDPQDRPTVAEYFKKIGGRVYPVGRLDFHTSGVLLVTNDGEFSEALLKPKQQVPKVYVAKMRGHLDEKDLEVLREGVTLEDGTRTRKAEVFVLREEERQSWLQFTLFEGKNRQIHRMGEAIGHPVLRLARTAFADITAEGLRPGQHRPLTGKELEKLRKKYLRQP